ncbi:MAG: type 4a pilus biogenesis protein PilO [Candidatus Nitrotoga sp.]
MNFKQLLDDIKNSNPKDPGSWPWAVKGIACAGLLISILITAYFLDWQGQLEELSIAEQQEVALKIDYENKKSIAINLESIKKKLIDTKESFDGLLKQLPSKSEMDALLTDINQAGLGRGLQFELFRPGAEIITGVFAVQPITIKVTGNYDDIGQFSSDVAQLPRIVSLTDISINPASSGQLVMDSTAKTYRYLDEEEIAAQKKAAKPGAAKK